MVTLVGRSFLYMLLTVLIGRYFCGVLIFFNDFIAIESNYRQRHMQNKIKTTNRPFGPKHEKFDTHKTGLLKFGGKI